MRERAAAVPLDFLLIPALLMFRSLLVHGYAAFGLVAVTWAGSLGAVGTAYAAVCAWGGTRQLLAALRTITLGCLWPFIAGLGYLSSIPRFLAWPYLIIVVLAFTLGNDGTDSRQIIVPRFETAGANWYRIVTTAAGVALVVVLAAWIVKQVLGPIFKVLADIFRYVGDPLYRAAIQKGLAEHLESSAPGGADVYVVGHSLGSVIAVHALMLRASVFDAARTVTLITLGSPLRRFFTRFFASTMPSPDEMACALARRFPGFRWINIYRPWDPIGTRLFHTSFPASRDFCTRQWWRILVKAHTDYWSDAHVAKCLRECLATTSGQVTAMDAAPEFEPFPECVGERRIPPTVSRVLSGLVRFGPVVLMFVNCWFAASYLERRDYREMVRTVEQDPVQAVAEVHSREILSPNGNGLPNAHSEVYITWPSDGSTSGCSARGRACEEDVVDSDLAMHLRADPHLHYRRGYPRVYYVPGYEPKAPGILALIGYTLWCAVLMVVWFWAAGRYVAPILSLWLGER